MFKLLSKKWKEHILCYKLNLFVENVLRIKSFAAKVTIMFLFMYFLSIVLSTIIFTIINTKSFMDEARENIRLATKIRQHLSQQKLDLFRLQLQKMIKAGMFEEIRRENIVKGIEKSADKEVLKIKQTYSLRDGNILIKVEGYEAIIDKNFLYDIIMSRAGIVSKYDPIFDINGINRSDSVCYKEKYIDGDFYLTGCIKKSTLIKMSVLNSLRISVIFLSILLLFFVLMHSFIKNVILFPLKHIIMKLDQMEHLGLKRTRLNLHRFGNDEIAYISKVLENFRISIVKNQEKMNLLFETVNKMISMTNNIHNFGLYVLNQLDSILELKGSLLIVSSHVESDDIIRSNRFLRINKNITRETIEKLKESKQNIVQIDSLKCIVINKSVEKDINILFVGFLEKDITEENINYLDIILSDFIYLININNLATQDFLTKLPNRRKLMSDLITFIELSKRYNKTLSLGLIDIDDFKSVNDTYGHDAGDMILMTIANIIKESLRDVDIVGRYGGEEFLVILPNTDLESAMNVAERIRSKIEGHKFRLNGNSVRLTVSTGVSTYGLHGTTVGDLIKATDVSLYKAKREGKNRVVAIPYDEILQVVKREFEAKDLLIKALEEERVVPFFQPIFESGSRSVIGYEVLARIYEPQKNMYILAYTFINDVLKYGFGLKIDNAIQEKALEYISKKGVKDKLFFFNLSKSYMSDIKILDNLSNNVARYGLRPENIVLEITEEEAIIDFVKVREFIRYGKYLGFRFAIDDFGAGYSNFIYIKNFSVDMIKIDGSLTSDIDKDMDDRVIVESIVKIAKHKNTKVIAEMVESQQEYEVLRDIGVDYIQGYYLSKPVKDI